MGHGGVGACGDDGGEGLFVGALFVEEPGDLPADIPFFHARLYETDQIGEDLVRQPSRLSHEGQFVGGLADPQVVQAVPPVDQSDPVAFGDLDGVHGPDPGVHGQRGPFQAEILDGGGKGAVEPVLVHPTVAGGVFPQGAGELRLVDLGHDGKDLAFGGDAHSLESFVVKELQSRQVFHIRRGAHDEGPQAVLLQFPGQRLHALFL